MTATPLLDVRDLKVHFPVKTRGALFGRHVLLKALDGVSFSLAPGETLGVVGESGCGKSTLGRAVLQLIRPTAGEVVWLGRPIQELSVQDMRPLRRDMQMVFQDPLAALDPCMTVGEIVGEPLDTFMPSLSKADAKERVKEMMAKVGLSPHMVNRYPHEFSGGQCQRIGIARAMILNPKLIVCDEPVSALDVSIQAQIVNLLMRLQREFNLSLILISHDLSVVRHISHRILVLYLGRMMELASRDELYANPRHPYTQALISAVPIPTRTGGGNASHAPTAARPLNCRVAPVSHASKATALCEWRPGTGRATHSVICHTGGTIHQTSRQTATVQPSGGALELSGCMIKANSETFLPESSSSLGSPEVQPWFTSAIWWIGSANSGSGLGETSTGAVSAPSIIGSLAISHSAAFTPMPGLPLRYFALSLPHSLPQPVLKMIASPAWMLMFCFFIAPSMSATVISYLTSRMSTPLRPAMSISTPRVISMPTLWMPSLVKPVRVVISSVLKQL
jgi:oligopeptide transport system ATP-binding protein